eukprot:PhF_6_TR19724/c0_g1_i3/m.28790
MTATSISMLDRFLYTPQDRWFHVVVNYGMIAFLAFESSLVHGGPSATQGLISGVLLQAAIWTVEPTCYGVSLVWCYLLGRLVVGLNDLSKINKKETAGKQHLHHPYNNAPWRGPTVVFASCLVLYYYYVEFPFITTVAHGCAVGLGIVMRIFQSRRKKAMEKRPCCSHDHK